MLHMARGFETTLPKHLFLNFSSKDNIYSFAAGFWSLCENRLKCWLLSSIFHAWALCQLPLWWETVRRGSTHWEFWEKSFKVTRGTHDSAKQHISQDTKVSHRSKKKNLIPGKRYLPAHTSAKLRCQNYTARSTCKWRNKSILLNISDFQRWK